MLCSSFEVTETSFISFLLWYLYLVVCGEMSFYSSSIIIYSCIIYRGEQFLESKGEAEWEVKLSLLRMYSLSTLPHPWDYSSALYTITFSPPVQWKSESEMRQCFVILVLFLMCTFQYTLLATFYWCYIYLPPFLLPLSFFLLLLTSLPLSFTLWFSLLCYQPTPLSWGHDLACVVVPAHTTANGV